MNFEQVVASALELSPLERVRLMEKLAGSLESHLQQPTIDKTQPRKSLYGLWKGLDISSEDIDDLRRDMWANFPREDI